MTVLLPQFDHAELDEAHAEFMGYLQVLKMRTNDEYLARKEVAVEEDRAKRASSELLSKGNKTSDIEESWVTRAQYFDYNAENAVEGGVLDVENGGSCDIGALGVTSAQDVNCSAKNENKYNNVDVYYDEYSAEDERGSNSRALTSSEDPGDAHLHISNGFSSLHSLRMKASNTLHTLWR